MRRKEGKPSKQSWYTNGVDRHVTMARDCTNSILPNKINPTVQNLVEFEEPPLVDFGVLTTEVPLRQKL
jgi:hypothetical protein